MPNSPIVPTAGRIVLYRSADTSGEVPAIVTGVVDEDHVDLTVFYNNFTPGPVEGVAYNDDEVGPGAGSWRWMAYQKAVASGEIAPMLHAEPGAAVVEPEMEQDVAHGPVEGVVAPAEGMSTPAA